MRKSKKLAITRLVLISAAVLLVMFLAVAQFDVPFTNYRYNSFAGAIKQGFDFNGGIYAVYDIADTEDTTNLEERLTATVDKFRTTLNDNQLADSTVVKHGEQIRVEVTTGGNSEAILNLLGSPAALEFRYGDVTELSSEHINKAYISYDSTAGQYGVMVEFNKDGKKLYKDLVKRVKAEAGTISVNISGDNVSSITINSITATNAASNGKQMLLSSQFSTDPDSAYSTALQIMAGAFDVNLTLNKTDKITPAMGQHAKIMLIVTGAVAVLAVAAYMIIKHRAMGAMSALSFVLFASLYLLFLYSFPIGQFTLMGMLAVFGATALAGMAYFTIFGRIAREYAAGKTVNASVSAGFSKSLWTVLDSHIITALLGAFCIIFGGTVLQSLGIILVMGAILSLLSSLLVNRYLIKNLVTITPDNAGAYNLVREEGVEEIPDEVISRKDKKSAAARSKPVESEQVEDVDDEIDTDAIEDDGITDAEIVEDDGISDAEIIEDDGDTDDDAGDNRDE